MAFTLNDRVRETSTTEGTGAYALLGNVSSFRTFSSAIGSGNLCNYVATMGSQWEIGIGTVTGGGSPSLSRTTILASSNAGAAVNWTAGTKDLRCDASAPTVMQCYRGASRWAGTLGGTAAAITGTVSPVIYEYWAGLTIHCITNFALTNSAPTINFNALGAVNLREHNASAIPTTQILSNELMTVVNDGSIFRITRTLAFAP